MIRTMMKSKLHRLTVTEANINYEGSITIDSKLLQKADILQGEKVLVVNISNGSRFETYAMKGRPGEACLNGGAARMGTPGDRIIVITYAAMDEDEAKRYRPIVILVDDNNRIKKG